SWGRSALQWGEPCTVAPAATTIPGVVSARDNDERRGQWAGQCGAWASSASSSLVLIILGVAALVKYLIGPIPDGVIAKSRTAVKKAGFLLSRSRNIEGVLTSELLTQSIFAIEMAALFAHRGADQYLSGSLSA